MGQAVRVGLTGGIGSGKSTVLALLCRLGASGVDADAISRSVTATGGTAIGAVREAFGPELIGADGALDRQKMRDLAYADPTARKRLEAIVHPLVGEETRRQAENAERLGSRCIVFDIPLLVESGRWRQRVDWVLVVDCALETQIARVMARNGLDRAAVQRIIQAQASRQQRLAAADVVVCNEGPLDLLEQNVQEAARRFGL